MPGPGTRMLRFPNLPVPWKLESWKVELRFDLELAFDTDSEHFWATVLEVLKRCCGKANGYIRYMVVFLWSNICVFKLQVQLSCFISLILWDSGIRLHFGRARDLWRSALGWGWGLPTPCFLKPILNQYKTKAGYSRRRSHSSYWWPSMTLLFFWCHAPCVSCTLCIPLCDSSLASRVTTVNSAKSG